MAKKLIKSEKLQRQSEKLEKRFESRSEEVSREEARPPRSALSEDDKDTPSRLMAPFMATSTYSDIHTLTREPALELAAVT